MARLRPAKAGRPLVRPQEKGLSLSLVTIEGLSRYWVLEPIVDIAAEDEDATIKAVARHRSEPGGHRTPPCYTDPV